MSRFKIEHERIDMKLVRLLRSFREVDILFSKNERHPFLFRARWYFGVGIILFSVGLPCFLNEYSGGRLYSMFYGLVFVGFILFNFVVLLFLFYYFEAIPINKRMKHLGFDVSGFCIHPLGSDTLFQYRLSEIDARCIEAGFFSGQYDDIERISMYVVQLKELILSEKAKDSRRLLNSSQLAAAFFLLTAGLVSFLLQPQPLEPLTIQGLVGRVGISLLVFAVIIVCLMLGNSFFRLYHLLNDRKEIRLREACDILIHIQLNLIYCYSGQKKSVLKSRKEKSSAKHIVTGIKKGSQKQEKGLSKKSKIKKQAKTEQSGDGEVRVTFL